MFLGSYMHSQNYENPWAVSLGGNYITFSDMNSWKSTVMPSLSFYRHTHDGFSLGTRLNFNNITDEISQETFAYFSSELVLKYSINRIFSIGNFDPYLEIGFGNSITKKQSTLHSLLNIGIQYWFLKRWGMKTHTSYRSDFLRRSLGAFQVSASIVFRFGGWDKDKDGVYDKIDICPNLAGSALLRGCPDDDGDGVENINDDCPKIKGLLHLSGCPDKDKDDVPDYKDRCPNVYGKLNLQGCPDMDNDFIEDDKDKCPKVAGVLENFGCPWPDQDQDQVPDREDRCPKVKGSVVNDGCPEPLTEETQKELNDYAKVILFKTGTAEIIEESQEVLLAISTILKDFPYAKFKVEGHTDNTGSNKLNQKISEMRANAVRDQLIELGIPEKNLVAIGYGELRPIATNNTDIGRKENRRVEINLIH